MVNNSEMINCDNFFVQITQISDLYSEPCFCRYIKMFKLILKKLQSLQCKMQYVLL